MLFLGVIRSNGVSALSVCMWVRAVLHSQLVRSAVFFFKCIQGGAWGAGAVHNPSCSGKREQLQ